MNTRQAGHEPASHCLSNIILILANTSAVDCILCREQGMVSFGGFMVSF